MRFLNSFCRTKNPSSSWAYLLCAMVAVGLVVPKSLTVVPVVFGLLFLPQAWRDLKQKPSPLFLSFLGFMAATLLSCFFSPDSAFSLEKWAKSFALCLCIFGCLSFFSKADMDKKTLFRITLFLTAAVALSGLYLYIEYAYQYPIYRTLFGIEDGAVPNAVKGGYLHNRASVFTALMITPVLYLIGRCGLAVPLRFGLAAVAIVPVFFMTLVSESQTSFIVFILAFISLLYPYAWKPARIAAMAGVVCMLIATPFVMPRLYTALQESPLMQQEEGWFYEASAINRLEVWDFLSRRVMESPLIGHGMESTRFLKADHVMPHMRTDHIMHPHNISIQLWLETGVLGVVLFLVFTVFLYRSVVARAEKEQKYMFVLVMPVLANLSMSYSMWQAWQLGMICTLAALITTAASAKENNQT